jgi:hypothetical protein
MNAVLLALALIASAASPPPPTHPLVIAAFPVTQPNAPPGAKTDGSIDDDIRAALTIPGYAPVSRAAIEQTLAAAKALGFACDTARTDCLLRLGALASADIVVGGTIGDGSLLLHVIDVAAFQERASPVVPLGSDGAQRARDLRGALLHVLAPDRERGSLIIRVAQRGATVVVDGAIRGTSPLPRALALTPGKHAIYVALAGYSSAVHNDVDVSLDGVTTLDIALVPGDGGQPMPPEPTLAPPRAPAAPPPAAPSPPVAASAPKVVRVAVYDAELAGVAPRVGRFFSDNVVTELRKLDGFSVVGMDEIRALLEHEATRQSLGCSDEKSCVGEIADAFGVDVIVVSRLAAVGDESTLTMRRIEPATARAVDVSQRLTPDDGVEFLAAVGGSVEKLFPDARLRAGAKRGVPDEVALALNPPPVAPAATISLAAATVLAACAAGGVGLFELQGEATFGALVAKSKTTTIDAVSVSDARAQTSTLATTTNVLWIVAGSAAVATAIAAPLTNWRSLTTE